ncbi:MAG: carboxyl transferase domain-containing protein [Actinomycetota bacterium]
MTERPSALQRISSLTDSFDEQDAGLVGGDPLGFEGYGRQLESARAESGLNEACVWGWAEIEGAKCALVVTDFAFLGGSMGLAVGEKVANAFDAARRVRLPVVTVTASGGARMQEGMFALAQMASTTEARRQHRGAGLAQVTLLTSPTTGGVYASFASLADVVAAEPLATVGFAGPRVVAELTGAEPPADLHTAEFAFEHGLIDAIVPSGDQRSYISRALLALAGHEVPERKEKTRSRSLGAGAAGVEPRTPTAWEQLQLVRDPARPKARTILDALLDEPVELCGDRTGEPDDEHVVVQVGHLWDTETHVVAIGQEAVGDGRIRPQGFRKAIRAIELAERVGFPVVTIIDTRGADPLPSSEGGGIAAAIAQTFMAMLECHTPTVAVVTGEGGSGGALAMATADRVIAWSNAVFSVIAPEGAAAILYRDGAKAPELAERLKITATDLVAAGIVDEVIAEPEGGVQANPEVAATELAAVVAGEVERLMGVRSAVRRRRRTRRWRRLAAQHVGQRTY